MDRDTEKNWSDHIGDSTHHRMTGTPVPDEKVLSFFRQIYQMDYEDLPTYSLALQASGFARVIPKYITVLGPFLGEELIITRKYFPRAEITAFESFQAFTPEVGAELMKGKCAQFLAKVPDKRTRSQIGSLGPKGMLFQIADAFGIKLFAGPKEGDYTQVDECISRIPELFKEHLLICRAPRIMQFHLSGGLISYDEVNINAVAKWISLIAQSGAQMMVTFYTLQEMRKVQRILQYYSTDTYFIELPAQPEQMIIEDTTTEGPIKGYADHYVLRLGSKI